MDTILVVDDDPNICWAFEQFLQGEGYTTLIASNAEDGLKLVAEQKPDLVLLDVRLPGISGLEALQQIKASHRQTQIVVMSAYDSVENTIQSMCLQAFDFLPKPIDLNQVRSVLDRATQLYQARDKIVVSPMETVVLLAEPKPHLIGKSPQMLEVYKLIGIMAGNVMTVLIEGENGTGKGLVARAIHENSARRHQPFVTVDCGALPDELLESELFGYEAGAFTGAQEKGKLGKFELADGGTLFLDEIGNMSAALQMRFLRTLQEREIDRLGGTRTIPINVRVIAATNANLEQVVQTGLFRKDLYYRLKRVPVPLPPLRERPEDIPSLAQHFLNQSGIELNRSFRGISEECLAILQAYPWPGNVREIENAVKSAAVISRSDVILPDHLPSEIQTFTVSLETAKTEIGSVFSKMVKQTLQSESGSHAENGLYKEMVHILDRELILALRQELGNNHSKIAKQLGISRTTLLQKIKTLDM